MRATPRPHVTRRLARAERQTYPRGGPFEQDAEVVREIAFGFGLLLTASAYGRRLAGPARFAPRAAGRLAPNASADVRIASEGIAVVQGLDAGGRVAARAVC